ncbi:MAG: hypothetical protein Q4C04_06855 [Clostridia bacterium]|nr:hypothetical protein [Clostridia bacterium]
MSTISEKVAYLEGLMDGLNVKEDKHGKLFAAIAETLSCIAEELSDHEDTLAELSDEVDDLNCAVDVYDSIMFDDDDDDEEDSYDLWDEDEFTEIICPNCGETIHFDVDLLDVSKDIACPNCGEVIVEREDDELSDE